MPRLEVNSPVCVSVPGTMTQKVVEAGEQHDFTDEQAERLTRLGIAEKPSPKAK